MAIHILRHAGLAAVAATVCFLVRWPVPGAALAILAFGLATAWVNIAYSRLARGGKTPPRWLAFLERLRQYLASEEGEPGQDAQTAPLAPR